MTKTDLETLNEELKEKLEEQLDRIKTLENKNKEYANIIKEKDAYIDELRDQYQNELDKLKKKYQEELVTLKDSNTKNTDMLAENYEKQIKNLYDILAKREQQLNKLLDIFGNTLKTMQGTIDNAIIINDYFINEVNK